MKPQSRLLCLPFELRLHIARQLVSDQKRNRHIHSLLDLALTCRQLASVAREALCLAPVLQSSKVDSLLRFLFEYPGLARKIGNLTIETREVREHRVSTTPIPGLEPGLLVRCERHVRTLPIDRSKQDDTITLLKRDHFKDHSVLLGVLLTMLPQLTQLYLGGSILLNFPMFQTMTHSTPSLQDWSTSDWAAEGPDLRWLMSLLGPQLSALELPIDFRRTPDADTWTPLRVSQMPRYLPNLRWLSKPHMTASEMTGTAGAHVFPPRLETLLLTDARCHCCRSFFEAFLKSEQLRSGLRLSRIALYHRYSVVPVDEDITKALADVGVEVTEYIPDCCLRSGDEFYHPWRYSPMEIGALEGRRHARLGARGMGQVQLHTQVGSTQMCGEDQ